MLSAISIVPATPVLVPELVGAAAAETADLREAALAAVSDLPARWLVVGVGPRDVRYGPSHTGTFAGYGVDVPVALGAGAHGEPVELPLCALIAGWLRGHAGPGIEVDVDVSAAANPLATALAHGRALRAAADETEEPVGALVVADGLNTLSPSAPGGHRPESVETQQALDDALALGDVAALIELPDTVADRVAFQVLAGLTGRGPGSARELYRGAPFGVGYFVGQWLP